MKRPDTSSPVARRRLAPGSVLLAALSGTLVVLSFPLFGAEMGLDVFIWIALVPLFLAATGAGGREGLLLGWHAGAIVEGAGFIWILLAIRRFTDLPWPLATLGFLAWMLWSTIPWALLGGLLGTRSRPAGVLAVLPLWVGLEHYYPRLFPWHLGGALYDRGWLVQTADVWGASGLTALVFLGNAVAYLAILALGRRERFPRLAAAALVVLLASSLAYGKLRLDAVLRSEAAAPRLRAALLQGAIDPRDRTQRALAYYVEATRKVTERGGIDLVVWPEGAVPVGKDLLPFDVEPARNPDRDRWRGRDPAEFLSALAAKCGVPIAAGGAGYAAGRVPPISNVLAWARPNEPVSYYQKNVRLLFGEWVPFLDLVPESVLDRFGIQVATIAAGTTDPLLPLGNFRFRGLICYEATLPGYVRRAAPGADFLLNVTEDIWYGRTAQIPQHLSVLRLRAIENRTPILRCTNIGPSGVVAASGRFTGGERVFAPENVVVDLRPGGLPTLYRTGGAYLPLGALLVGALGGLAARRSLRRVPRR